MQLFFRKLFAARFFSPDHSNPILLTIFMFPLIHHEHESFFLLFSLSDYETIDIVAKLKSPPEIFHISPLKRTPRKVNAMCIWPYLCVYIKFICITHFILIHEFMTTRIQSAHRYTSVAARGILFHFGFCISPTKFRAVTVKHYLSASHTFSPSFLFLFYHRTAFYLIAAHSTTISLAEIVFCPKFSCPAREPSDVRQVLYELFNSRPHAPHTINKTYARPGVNSMQMKMFSSVRFG